VTRQDLADLMDAASAIGRIRQRRAENHIYAGSLSDDLQSIEERIYIAMDREPVVEREASREAH